MKAKTRKGLTATVLITATILAGCGGNSRMASGISDQATIGKALAKDTLTPIEESTIPIEEDAASTEKTPTTVWTTNQDLLHQIRIPNSDETMYIEGLSDEEASNTDQILRLYEQADGSENSTYAGELAWLYEPLKHTVADWFNPDFDLPGELRSTWGDKQIQGIDPLANDITMSVKSYLDTYQDEIYFKEDPELGGYRMSARYYILGYLYTSLSLAE